MLTQSVFSRGATDRQIPSQNGTDRCQGAQNKVPRVRSSAKHQCGTIQSPLSLSRSESTEDWTLCETGTVNDKNVEARALAFLYLQPLNHPNPASSPVMWRLGGTHGRKRNGKKSTKKRDNEMIWLLLTPHSHTRGHLLVCQTPVFLGGSRPIRSGRFVSSSARSPWLS